MTATAPVPSEQDARSAAWFTAAVHPGGRVVLTGELDIAGLDAFRAALDQALLEPAVIVRIDASGLSFIDSTAISELLRYQLTATARRRQFFLEEVSRPVAQVLDLLDLRHILMAPDATLAAPDEPEASQPE